MRSSAELAILAAALALGGCSHGALPDAPSVPPVQSDTAVGTDQPGAGYAQPGLQTPPADDQPPAMPAPRYDNVGYASWTDEPGPVTAAHRSLSPGSFAEVTSLDTGKTILAPITAVARSDREIELSGAAAQQLGLSAGMRGGVRVRAVNPGEADVAALRDGRAAAPRPDTPPVLLNPLRRKLGGAPAARPTARPAPPATRATPPVATAPRTPAPRAAPPPAATRIGFYVQIAALSDPAKARTLARSLGGTVVSGGGLHRVRIGPYPDSARAVQARDGMARRGYGDARIVRQD